MYACGFRRVLLLLLLSMVMHTNSGSLSIDEHNYHGKTALIEAVQDQNEELVKLLLVNGANIHKSDNSGDTPLILAIKNHNQELIDLLVNNGADINTQDKWGNPPLGVS